MKRLKKNRIPSGILCSDMHLREDIPICWTEDFQSEQWSSVDFVSDLQKEYKCPVIHAGDLFNHWKPSPWLIRMALRHLPDQFYTVYGQHDLPQHNLELADKCGIDVLKEADRLNVLPGYHYGQVIYTGANRIPLPKFEKVLVWHNMTYTVKPYPQAGGGFAIGKLMKYPQYDLIVTGDNHQSFYIKHEGRLLVNPGNLTRQVADQIDYKPRVALWYAEDNTIEWIYIPIKEGVISREHIDHVNERDKRIDAFISKLDGEWEAGTSFEQNLTEFQKTNTVADNVMQIIYKAIE